MESEFKPLKIECPNCGSTKLLKVPLSIYSEKKFGIIKIKVPEGAVCQNHQFIVLTDTNQNILGYEKIDISISKFTEEPKESKNGITVKYLVDLLGFDCVVGLLHAKLFNYTSYIITNKNINIDLTNINRFFDNLIPDQYGQTPPIKFLTYNRKIYPIPENYYFFIRRKMKGDFLINLERNVVNIPWDTDSNYERIILKNAIEIGNNNGYKIVQSYFTQFLKDVDLTKNTLKNNSNISDKKLIKELNQKSVLSTISKDRIKLIREFFHRRNYINSQN